MATLNKPISSPGDSVTVGARAALSESPVTSTLKLVFSNNINPRMRDDLLFLENWEISPLPGSAMALRARQLRRANPELAVAIHDELHPKPKMRRASKDFG